MADTDRNYYTHPGVPQGVSVMGGDAVPRVSTMHVHCDGCTTGSAAMRICAKAGFSTARSLRLCVSCGTTLIWTLTNHLASLLVIEVSEQQRREDEQHENR